MKRKRKFGACLMAALLLTTSTIPQAFAEGEEPTLPDVPEITIAGTKITGDQYFELGLKVKAKQFQTVGVVLSYDNTKLQPVTWTDGSELTVSGNSWEMPTIIHTRGAGGVSGKPALAYKDDAEGSNRSYLYLGAESLKYVAQNGADQLVTARFKYIKTTPEDGSEPAVPEITVPADGVSDATIMLAPIPVADKAIPGEQALVTTSADSVYTLTTEPPCTVSFALGTGAGIGVSGGGGSGDYAITFFDWDGTVVDAIAADSDATVSVKTISDSLKDSKSGYVFDTWLNVTPTKDGPITANGTLTSNKVSVASSADAASFTNVNSTMFVQAAYRTTDAVNGGNGADASLNEGFSRYQISQPTYYQYGVSNDDVNGQYAVRAKVNRNSVLRADEPVVMAIVYVGSGSEMKSITSRLDLVNTDETSFEVVVPKSTTQVTLQVLDTYQVTPWTVGAGRSAQSLVPHDDIIKGGSFALLVQEAWNAAHGSAWSTDVNSQCFKDAGYPKVNDSNLNAAKTALQNASTGATPLDRGAADAALAAYK